MKQTYIIFIAYSNIAVQNRVRKAKGVANFLYLQPPDPQ